MSDELVFHGSAKPTIGAELEVLVLDPATGDLAPGGQRILEACNEEHLEGITGEFMLSMLEVKTDVCENVSQIRDSLYSRLRRARNVATTLGYDLAIGGAHPTARPTMVAIFPSERYHKIEKRLAWMAYQEAVFGLHVHVGVPTGDAAIGVTNLLVEYLPHLIALASNSPFWQGVDTGFASMRMLMFRPSGSAGLPPHFENWQAFNQYCRVMQQAGLMESTKDLYWDIRPQPKFGTVEFRIFDAPADLATILGLCALTRCLVVDALNQIEQTPAAAKGDMQKYWLASENRWLSTRFGLKTRCVRHPGDPIDTLAAHTARLVERLLPVAESLGETSFLKTVDPAHFETGAERQRHLYREHADWLPVLAEMKNRWVQELGEVRA